MSPDCYLGKCDECVDVEKKVEPVFKVERDSTVGGLDCPYFQWNDENKKTSVASTLAEAQREAMKQLAVMKGHCFIAKTQLHQKKCAHSNSPSVILNVSYKKISPRTSTSNNRTK